MTTDTQAAALAAFTSDAEKLGLYDTDGLRAALSNAITAGPHENSMNYFHLSEPLYKVLDRLIAAIAATQQPAEEVMLNGLTKAETDATASVFGLTRAAPSAPEQPSAAVDALTWYEGAPPFPQDQEWFIAETSHGGRVVLRSIDEGREHKGNYAFKTADETYMRAELVKRWMQFPDCEYLPPEPAAPPEPLRVGAQPSIERIIEWIRNNYQDHNIASLCEELKAKWYERQFDAPEVLATLSAANTQPTSAAAGGVPTIRRYSVNPDTGHLFETPRGAWVRYVDIATTPGGKP